jgi:hypothetical protein
MTEYKAPHRAKPEVWAAVERWGKNDLDTLNCLLELRDRVEALEGAQQPTVKDSLTVSADSLVEQVADVIAKTFAPYVTADNPARAAILTVADWFKQQGLNSVAKLLQQEAQ